MSGCSTSRARGPCTAISAYRALASTATASPTATLCCDVGEVLLDVRRVDDEQEVVVGEAIDQQIVDEGALRRSSGRNTAPGRSAASTRRCSRCAGPPRARPPGHLDLAHVADVEQAGALADREVLVGDAGVLDGHVPPAERHHAGARRAMAGVQRRLLERSGGSLFHGRVVHEACSTGTGNGTMRASAGQETRWPCTAIVRSRRGGSSAATDGYRQCRRRARHPGDGRAAVQVRLQPRAATIGQSVPGPIQMQRDGHSNECAGGHRRRSKPRRVRLTARRQSPCQRESPSWWLAPARLSHQPPAICNSIAS